MPTQPAELDSLMTRGLPAAVDIERLVLGATMAHSAENMPVVADLLEQADFSLLSHQTVFGRMLDLFSRSEAIDRVTLANALIAHGELDKAGGVTGLVSLDEGLPEIYHLDRYCRVVREKALLRMAILRFQAGMAQLCEPSATLEDLRAAKESLLAIDDTARGRRRGFRSIADVISNEEGGGPSAFFDPPKDRLGIPWPLPTLTWMTGGFAPGQITVIKADTGIGKTTLACQAALHAVQLENPAAVLTLEMSCAEIAMKLISQAGQACMSDWLRGESSRDDRQRIRSAAKGLYDQPLYFDDRPEVTPAMLHAALAAMRGVPFPKLLVIDYVQLMDSGLRDAKATREQHIASISRALKRMAKTFSLSVIALSQVNKEGGARESAAIEHDATFVVQLKSLGHGSYEAALTKGRFAARRKVSLSFDGATGLFSECGGVE